MEIRQSLVYCPRQGKVIGFTGDVARNATSLSQTKIVPDDLAKTVSQFFLVSLDGNFCVPILHAGYDAKNPVEHLKKCLSQIQDLVLKLSNGRVKIIGGSSDGALASIEFATTQTVFAEYHHLGDFSHLVKRMRNTLLSSPLFLEENGQMYEFSIHTLSELHGKESLLRELLGDGSILCPQDRMDMDPVLKLLDVRIRNLLRSHMNPSAR
jgi:hypothetical protein